MLLQKSLPLNYFPLKKTDQKNPKAKLILTLQLSRN